MMSISLAKHVGRLLRENGMYLATAESCTGGLLSDLITDVPGSSDYFAGGIIAYANDAKINLLGVRKQTIDTYGAVSQETALEMAKGVRTCFASERFLSNHLLGLSTTGIAGAGGSTPGKPVGLVWIGLSSPYGDQAWQFQWSGNRAQNKRCSADKALQILVELLESQK